MSALRFAGYAALFDRRDRGGDVVRPGAFLRTLEASRGRVPLLWQHDPRHPIGTLETVREDGRGLRVIGRVSPATAAGQEAAALLREGAVSGLSFGYRVERKAVTPRGRDLLDLDLVEVSLVTFPMQPAARVHALADG